MASPNLRRAARAIILTEDHHILLCQYPIASTPGRFVWATPGGGVEKGETNLAALRRELLEEVGLSVDGSPPHVWHQEVVTALPGYDGVLNDYYLVRTATFEPRGSMSDDELAAEDISEVRWWSLEDIASYRGTDLFSPRDLATLVTALITHGVPAAPLSLGK